MLVRDLFGHPLYLYKWKKFPSITGYFSGQGGGMVLRTVSWPLFLEYKLVKYWKSVDLFSVLTSYCFIAPLELVHIYFQFLNAYIEFLWHTEFIRKQIFVHHKYHAIAKILLSAMTSLYIDID